MFPRAKVLLWLSLGDRKPQAKALETLREIRPGVRVLNLEFPLLIAFQTEMRSVLPADHIATRVELIT